MGQAGVPIVEIKELVGHATAAFTLSVYTHSQPDVQRQGVETYTEGLSLGKRVKFCETERISPTWTDHHDFSESVPD
jgi:hypothetical protein